ncbi:hypothetical protein HB364_18100 [Pseudoflavitalea sp. X16]|uniref:hypothetical protein n=1 Tax=Paraflavitalea devenefica TaxID=2716334 RepID=UPI0014213F09|nr:hypothetical protein [Paraflavitalea devenefica]NII27009.1 hypothetical protein [Paraflavitalea devenefica]
MSTNSLYSLPLLTAIEYTRRWRTQGHNIKAFTIDVAELNDIIDEYGKKIPDFKPSQIRIYFGINSQGAEALVLIGVDDEGHDILTYVDSKNIERPGTYDFTHPCPDTCDNESPLSHD